jgi:hypothetical protein
MFLHHGSLVFLVLHLYFILYCNRFGYRMSTGLF